MIPFIDLKSQFLAIEHAIRLRMDAVLEHGQYIMGPEIKELEVKLAAYTGAKHCITCASGTDALQMALMAKGVGPGDAVLTTPFTFFATVETIMLLGATPLFADIDENTWNISEKEIEKAIAAAKSQRLSLKGIIPVDIFGLPCNYEPINAVAKANQLWVLQDAAQSFGASYGAKRSGAHATVGCTSFFPAKPLGCYGDGGAIFTDDEEQARLFASLRVHGQGDQRYEHVRIGLTSRLDTLQAAVLLAKLVSFDEELAQRQRVADRYTEEIRHLMPILTPQLIPSGSRSAWAQYSVVCKSAQQRAALRDTLARNGVPTAVYYPIPMHQQKALAHLGKGAGTFPHSEDIAGRIFALPMHPYLDDSEVKRIVEVMASSRD